MAAPREIDVGLKTFLAEHNLSHLTSAFIDEGYDSLAYLVDVAKDGDALDEILDDVGVTKAGHRRRIKHYLQSAADGGAATSTITEQTPRAAPSLPAEQSTAASAADDDDDDVGQAAGGGGGGGGAADDDNTDSEIGGRLLDSTDDDGGDNGTMASDTGDDSANHSRRKHRSGRDSSARDKSRRERDKGRRERKPSGGGNGRHASTYSSDDGSLLVGEAKKKSSSRASDSRTDAGGTLDAIGDSSGDAATRVADSVVWRLGLYQQLHSQSISSLLSYLKDRSDALGVGDSVNMTEQHTRIANEYRMATGLTDEPQQVWRGQVDSIRAGANAIGVLKRNASLWQETARGSLKKGTRTLSKITNDPVTSVELGQAFGGAVQYDGSLVMWGANYNTIGPLHQRQAGLSNKTQITHQASAEDVEFAKVHKVSIMSNAVKIGVVACGYGAHAAAIAAESGELYTWGLNDSGQLGRADSNTSRPGKVDISEPLIVAACGARHTVVGTRDGRVYAFGNNFHGQCGSSAGQVPISKPALIKWDKDVDRLIKDSGSPAIDQLEAGGQHCALLLHNGAVITWGSNAVGQLGRKVSFSKSHKPTVISELSPIRNISCGPQSTAMTSFGGQPYVCGRLCGPMWVLHQTTPRRVHSLGLRYIVEMACGETHLGALESLPLSETIQTLLTRLRGDISVPLPAELVPALMALSAKEAGAIVLRTLRALNKLEKGKSPLVRFDRDCAQLTLQDGAKADGDQQEATGSILVTNAGETPVRIEYSANIGGGGAGGSSGFQRRVSMSPETLLIKPGKSASVEFTLSTHEREFDVFKPSGILQLSLRSDKWDHTLALPVVYQFVAKTKTAAKSAAVPRQYFGNVSPNCMLSANDVSDVRYPPLGTGTFGIVTRASMLGRPVAVKMGRTPSSVLDGQTLAAWAREIETLSVVKHRNIVEFVGVVVEPPMIVLELMQCSLYQLYHAAPEKLRKQTRCLQIMIDVARGVAHLHGLGPPVLHRDLKSSNVLLTPKFGAKIADFDSHSSAANSRSGHMIRRGTVAWTAPEALMKTAESFTPRCDIYSIGIIMFEVWARTEPYSDARFDFEITQRVMGGGRPDLQLLDEKTPSHVKKTMQRCWGADPHARPAASALKQRLEQILQKIASK